MAMTLNKIASDVHCLGIYITNDALGCLVRDKKRRQWLLADSEEFKKNASPVVRTIGDRLAKNLSDLLNNKDGSPNDGARGFMRKQHIVIENEAIVVNNGIAEFRIPIDPNREIERAKNGLETAEQ